jgi:hypothetical protein
LYRADTTFSKNRKAVSCMDLWDKFFASGKISDYLKYASAERGEKDADGKRSGASGKEDR